MTSVPLRPASFNCTGSRRRLTPALRNMNVACGTFPGTRVLLWKREKIGVYSDLRSGCVLSARAARFSEPSTAGTPRKTFWIHLSNQVRSAHVLILEIRRNGPPEATVLLL